MVSQNVSIPLILSVCQYGLGSMLFDGRDVSDCIKSIGFGIPSVSIWLGSEDV